MTRVPMSIALPLVMIMVSLIGSLTAANIGQALNTTITCSNGTMSCSSGTVTTLQLNLTRADVNASRSNGTVLYSTESEERIQFLKSSWYSNHTLAQISVNSTDMEGEAVVGVWHLNQSYIENAQIIRYDFNLSTHIESWLPPGNCNQNGCNYGPRLGATVGFYNSDFNGWYVQDRYPMFPNGTESVSVTNVDGLHPDNSFMSSLLFEAGRVTDAGAPSSGDRGISLFHQEHLGYAGDGILHRYSIEMDLRSNRTIWIVDDSVIATFRISFVPSVIVFTGSSSDVGNFAVASLQDPIQVAVPTAQANNDLVSSLQDEITSLNGKIDNLEAQVARLPSQNPLWFSQWWFSIIWGLLGAGLGALLFMKAPALRMRMRGDSVGLIGDQGNVACPQCGILMPFSSIFCGGCGNKLRKAKLSCPQCGGQMPLSSDFCGTCGTRLREVK